MIVADVLGPWWNVEATETDAETGMTRTYRDQRRLPQLLHDIGEMPWQDVTGQASEHIPLTIGLGVWRVWLNEKQLALLEADARYVVIRTAACDGPFTSPQSWPRFAVGPEREGADDAFPSLPPAGTWLDKGTVYQQDGKAVVVRQAHVRTERLLTEEPERFLVSKQAAALAT